MSLGLMHVDEPDTRDMSRMPRMRFLGVPANMVMDAIRAPTPEDVQKAEAIAMVSKGLAILQDLPARVWVPGQLQALWDMSDACNRLGEQ